MCTASEYLTANHYFGRNFDYEISYNERALESLQALMNILYTMMLVMKKE